MAVLVCSAIAGLHFYETQTLGQATLHLNSFRQARIDLAQAFIRITLADYENTPFNREQGLALVAQAAGEFELQAASLGQNGDELTRFYAELDAFQNAVVGLPTGVISSANLVNLWIAFDHLEKLTETLDTNTLLRLNEQADTLNNVFYLTLIAAALLFSGIGIGVYRAERARIQAETRQREGEARYRSVVEDQTELICRFDKELRLTFVNRAYAQAFGMDMPALLGVKFLSLVPPSEHELVVAHIQSLTPQHPVATSANRKLMPDGSLRWFQWTDRARLDEAGNIVEYQSVGRDITERVQAAAALQESEQRLRLFVERAPAAVAMLDQDLRYILVSNRWLTDYKIAEANISGRSHYEILPDMPERWKEIYQRCLHGALESSEADPFPRADGTLDWVRWEIHPWRNAQDEIGGIIIFSEIITERKRAEDHIRKLNRTLSVLSDINQTIVRVRQVPTLLTQICQIAVERGNYPMAWIGILDPATRRVTPAAHAGANDAFLDQLNIALDDPPHEHSPIATVLRTGRHVICNDVETDPLAASLRAEALQLGHHALAVFPLTVAGQTRGAITLCANERDFFDADELRLLDEQAGDIAFALEFAEQEEARLRSAAALRASEEKYRSLVDSSTAEISMVDADGVLLYANQIAAETLGQTPESALGKPLSELFVPAAARYRLEGIQQVIRTAESLTIEASSPVQGEERWFRTSIQPVRDATGSVAAALINAVDITVLKQTEAALRRANDTLERRVQERMADLQAEKARVEAILHNSPDGILLVDAQLHIQQANAAFHRHMCCAEDVCYNRTLDSLVHPDDTDKVLQLVQNAATKQGENYTEVRLFRMDGTLMETEFNIGRIEDAGLVCVVRDITERKHAEEALRASEERFRQIAENFDQILYLRSADDQQMLYINPQYERLWGQSRASLYADPNSFVKPIHPEDMSILRDGQTTQRYLQEGLADFEYRIITPEGLIRWVRARTFPIRDAAGAIVLRAGIIEDITERKQTQDDLLASEKKYRQLIENMHGGLAIIDEDNRFAFMNDRFCEQLGYTRDEITGTSADVYIAPENREVLARQLELMGQLQSSSFEVLVRRKDGSTVCLLVSASPLVGQDDTYKGSLAVTTDITLQKEAEEALRQALAKEKELGDLKTRFVSMASHEFRTPLASILALVETLSAYHRKLPEAQIDQKYTRIKEQIGYLKDIMEDVLMLARIQGRRLEFNPVQLDPDALTRSIIDEFQSHPNIQHQLDFQSTLQGQRILLDRKLMRQILGNLVSNAIKYSAAGTSIRIRLGATPTEMKLQVSDEGIGIPEADLPYLFEPFHRAENVSTISGTGLELVIAKESVELHGGTVEVESQLGIGTTFTIRIPLVTTGKPNNNENPGH